MATNSEAMDQLHNATMALLAAWGKATPSGYNKLTQATHVLKREYYSLLGLDGGQMDDPYRVITDEFKHSKTLIQGIIDDRNQIISNIKLATQVAQALAPLVALL
jgi:hypothetical protein